MSATTPEKAAQPLRKRRSFGRRVLRVALVLVVLLVILRLALIPGVPFVLARVGAAQGLDVQVDDVRLALLRGNVHVRGLTVRPAEARGETLVELDTADFDLDVSALFGGTVRILRAEVDGLFVRAQRDAEGRHSLAALFGEPGPRTADDDEEDDDETDEEPLDLRLPVELVYGRLQHVRLLFGDAAVDPPIAAELELNVRAAHLGSAERPGELTVHLYSRELCDTLSVTGTLDARETAFEAAFSVRGRGLRAKPLAPWLADLGLRADADAHTVDLALHVSASTAPENPGVARVEVRMEGLELRGDGELAFALSGLEVIAPRVSPQSTHVDSVRVHGLRGEAHRLASGELSIAGIALVPSTASETTNAPDTAQPASDEKPATPPSVLEIARIALEDAELRFVDSTFEPPLVLALRPGLEVTGVVLDAKRPDAVARFEASLGGDGLWDDARITGPLRLMGDTRGAELELDVRGIDLDAARPLLARAGLEPTLEAGALRGRIVANVTELGEGGTKIEAGLEGLQFTDGDEVVFALGALALRDAELATNGDARIGEVALEGLHVAAMRGASGELALFGLRTRPAEVGAANTASAPAPVDAPTEPDSTPRVLLERLAVTGTRVTWRDETFAEPLELDLDDLGFVLTGLAVGGATDAEIDAPPAARLEAWLRAPGELGAIELTGDVALAPSPRMALEVRGSELTFAALAPYLAPFGLEPAFAAPEGAPASGGELTLSFELEQSPGASGPTLALRLSEVALTAQGVERLGLNSLDVSGVTTGPEGLVVQRIVLGSPRIAVERRADGAVDFLGLRWRQAVVDGVAQGTPQEKAPLASEPAPPSLVRIGGLLVVGAHVAWKDASVDPPVATAFDARAVLRELEIGPGAGDARVEVHAGIEGSLDRLALTGDVRLDPDDLQVELLLALDGLRAGDLAVYLPPDVRAPLGDGRLRARVSASAGASDEGGRKARVLVSEVQFSDGDGPVLLALERLALDAPRIDVAGGAVRVDEVAVEGLRLEMRRLPDGAIALLGVELHPASAEVAAPIEEPSLQTPPVQEAPRAPAERPPLPEVSLGRLAVGIEQLRVHDDTVEGAEPLDVRLMLVSRGPLRLLGPAPEDLPPIELDIVGHALPVIGSIAVHIAVAPFHADPELAIDFLLSGISGPGLLALAPDLATTVDARELEAGELSGKLRANLTLRRRSPLEFDMNAGFGGELTLDDFALRRAEGEDPAFGLESLRVDLASMRPATGDVHIRAIELRRPRLAAHNSTDGLHFAGLVVRAAPTTQPESMEVAAISPIEAAAPRAPDALPPATAAARTGEVRVDRFSIEGIDVFVVDDSVDPPVRILLTEFDFELVGLTDRAATEPIPIRFQTSLSAGVMPNATPSDESAVERPAFEEFIGSGSVTLFPAPTGRVRLELVGLELSGLRGLAAGGGVDLTGGTYDARLDVRLQGERGMSIALENVVANLALSEGADGPISRTLRLPAPLETVLFLLQNSAGEHRVPLSFQVGAGGISLASIASAAVGTLTLVVADAVASSPLRVLGGVSDLTGVGGLLGGNEAAPARTFADLDFEAGTSVLDAAAHATLEELALEMERDRSLVVVLAHALGAEDVVRVERFASPAPEDARALAEYLRTRKAELSAQRAAGAERTRAELAAGRSAEARVESAELGRLDVEIGELDAALDDVLELLLPGADRRRGRRTREAAVILAERRLAAAWHALHELGGSTVQGRIEVRRPRGAEPAQSGGGRVMLGIRTR